MNNNITNDTMVYPQSLSRLGGSLKPHNSFAMHTSLSNTVSSCTDGRGHLTSDRPRDLKTGSYPLSLDGKLIDLAFDCGDIIEYRLR